MVAVQQGRLQRVDEAVLVGVQGVGAIPAQLGEIVHAIAVRVGAGGVGPQLLLHEVGEPIVVLVAVARLALRLDAQPGGALGVHLA